MTKSYIDEKDAPSLKTINERLAVTDDHSNNIRIVHPDELRRLEREDKSTPTMFIFIAITAFICLVDGLYLFGIIERIRRGIETFMAHVPEYIDRLLS